MAENYIICDRTGRKILASKSGGEWTGRLVSLSDIDFRHPQEFVRGRVDNQSVPFVRNSRDIFVEARLLNWGDQGSGYTLIWGDVEGVRILLWGDQA